MAKGHKVLQLQIASLPLNAGLSPLHQVSSSLNTDPGAEEELSETGPVPLRSSSELQEGGAGAENAGVIYRHPSYSRRSSKNVSTGLKASISALKTSRGATTNISVSRCYFSVLEGNLLGIFFFLRWFIMQPLAAGLLASCPLHLRAPALIQDKAPSSRSPPGGSIS